jgi:hypothetical protein
VAAPFPVVVHIHTGQAEVTVTIEEASMDTVATNLNAVHAQHARDGHGIGTRGISTPTTLVIVTTMVVVITMDTVTRIDKGVETRAESDSCFGDGATTRTLFG